MEKDKVPESTSGMGLLGTWPAQDPSRKTERLYWGGHMPREDSGTPLKQKTKL